MLSPNTFLDTTLCHSLKSLIWLLEALKCSVPNSVKMCKAFSLCSVPLITALLPLACLNYATADSPVLEMVTISSSSFGYRTCHIVQNTFWCLPVFNIFSVDDAVLIWQPLQHVSLLPSTRTRMSTFFKREFFPCLWCTHLDEK